MSKQTVILLVHSSFLKNSTTVEMDDLHFLFSLKHLNISSRHDAEQITFTLQLPLLIIIKGLRTQSVKLNLGNQFMMFLVCLITKMTIDTNIAFANNLPNGKLRLRFNFPGEMGNGNYEALELSLVDPS